MLHVAPEDVWLANLSLFKTPNYSACLVPLNNNMLLTLSGKSLYIKRLFEKLKDIFMKATVLKCIRLIKPTVDENVILQSLLNNPGKKELTIFHFDVTSTVVILGGIY